MKFKCLGIAIFLVAFFGIGNTGGSLGTSQLEARTNQNFTTPARSAECSRRARRHADRNATRYSLRQSARGAVGGAAIGGLAGGSRRNAATGGLIGGGLGMVYGTTTNRWQSLYNRRYSACINGYSLR